MILVLHLIVNCYLLLLYQPLSIPQHQVRTVIQLNHIVSLNPVNVYRKNNSAISTMNVEIELMNCLVHQHVLSKIVISANGRTIQKRNCNGNSVMATLLQRTQVQLMVTTSAFI